MAARPNFEDTYPRYEFSELVRLGIALARSILRIVRRAHRTRARHPPAHPEHMVRAD